MTGPGSKAQQQDKCVLLNGLTKKREDFKFSIIIILTQMLKSRLLMFQKFGNYNFCCLSASR